jgi:hypothetical protein
MAGRRKDMQEKILALDDARQLLLDLRMKLKTDSTGWYVLYRVDRHFTAAQQTLTQELMSAA